MYIISTPFEFAGRFQNELKISRLDNPFAGICLHAMHSIAGRKLSQSSFLCGFIQQFIISIASKNVSRIQSNTLIKALPTISLFPDTRINGKSKQNQILALIRQYANQSKFSQLIHADHISRRTIATRIASLHTHSNNVAHGIPNEASHRIVRHAHTPCPCRRRTQHMRHVACAHERTRTVAQKACDRWIDHNARPVQSAHSQRKSRGNRTYFSLALCLATRVNVRCAISEKDKF